MDTQWEGIPTNELIDMFALGTSCPAMVGKPKIFIIQVTLIIILLLEIKETLMFSSFYHLFDINLHSFFFRLAEDETRTM